MRISDSNDLMGRWLAWLARGQEEAGTTPSCPGDDTIAALAEGRLDREVRAEVLPHVAACARCRAAVASVAQALADPAVSSEIAALEAPSRGTLVRLGRVALPLAAAVLLVMVSWPPRLDDDAPVHRAPTITAAAAPTAVSPVGAVASASRLVWTRTVGADRYRVTLFDAEGSVVYEMVLADTAVVLPDTVVSAGRLYLWKVEGRTGVDRWVPSELVQFSVVGSSVP